MSVWDTEYRIRICTYGIQNVRAWSGPLCSSAARVMARGNEGTRLHVNKTFKIGVF